MRNPFAGPIHLDPPSAPAPGREVRCTCPTSPFCRGQASADWLTCSTACRACKPPPWQPPVLSVAGVDGTPERAHGG